ncbi:HK97-gp10 family putative phage morphogenesis protein [Alkalimonas sp. NCh-2]|uniref:HK97-gp10 family putative phage morphogenesis protein n=1 Tax=Alkalimonas sp. NCh-2 TaxID=3144846 RepID=UPI0031F6EEC9
MSIQFSVIGLEQVMQKLENTSPKKQRQAYRAAARSGMRSVRREVQNNAAKIDNPGTPNSIARNVAIRAMPRRKLRQAGGSRFDIGISVGILGGARRYADSAENRRKGRAGQAYQTGGSSKNPGGDTWYWRLVEFGRAGFTIRSKSVNGRPSSLYNPQTGQNFGRRVGPVAAKPIMGRTLQQRTNQVMNDLMNRIEIIIQRTAK